MQAVHCQCWKLQLYTRIADIGEMLVSSTLGSKIQRLQQLKNVHESCILKHYIIISYLYFSLPGGYNPEARKLSMQGIRHSSTSTEYFFAGVKQYMWACIYGFYMCVNFRKFVRVAIQWLQVDSTPFHRGPSPSGGVQARKLGRFCKKLLLCFCLITKL